MKHLAFGGLLLSLITIGSALKVVAQDTTWLWKRPNTVKTNLLAPVSLFYERALSQRFALRTSIWAMAIPRGLFNEQSFINATVEGKIYTGRADRLAQKEHPAGFFVNPYIKVRSLMVMDHVGINPDVFEQETIRSVGAGLTLGYQWVAKSGFIIELFHGAGLMPVALTRYRRIESDGSITTKISGERLLPDIRSGVSLGYAF